MRAPGGNDEVIDATAPEPHRSPWHSGFRTSSPEVVPRASAQDETVRESHELEKRFFALGSPVSPGNSTTGRHSFGTAKIGGPNCFGRSQWGATGMWMGSVIIVR